MNPLLIVLFKHYSYKDLAITAVLVEENTVIRKRVEVIGVFTILNYLFERSIDREYFRLYKVLMRDETKLYHYFQGMARKQFQADNTVAWKQALPCRTLETRAPHNEEIVIHLSILKSMLTKLIVGNTGHASR